MILDQGHGFFNGHKFSHVRSLHRMVVLNIGEPSALPARDVRN
jgi:hypothetical protein